MLQTVQQYYRSIVGFVIMFFVLVSMLLFGVDFGGGSRSDSYAIKVNDQEVPFSKFYERKRQVEDRLRQQLGANYAQFAPQFLKNVNSNIVEDMITEELYSQFTDELGIVAGKTLVQKEIVDMFPAGQFSAQKYSQFLRQSGMSAPQFEQRVAESAKNQQLIGILENVSLSSETEAKIDLRQSKKKYDISYIELDPKSLVASVKDPSEEVLRNRHEEYAAQYEVPAKIKYSYAVLSPKKFKDIVEIADEDIELYYTDNMRTYSNPEQIKVRQISLKLPKKEDKAVRKNATEISKMLAEGKDFKELAKKHNVDKEVLKKSGELGWKKRGELSKPLEVAAFKIKEGGTTAVIEDKGSLYILAVEEYKPTTPKELAEVKDQIEDEIRRREAPAYTAIKAEELYAQWLEGEQTLTELAKENGLKIESTGKLLSNTEDPAAKKGLTRKVITTPEQIKQLADSGEDSILIEVTDYEESHIAPFESVKDKVLEEYKQEEARTLAKERAVGLHAELIDNKITLKKIADEEKTLSVKSEKELTKATLNKIPFTSSPDISKEITAASAEKVLGSNPIESNGKYYLAMLDKVITPETKTLKDEIEKARETTSTQVAQALQMSVRNILKAEAEIDLNQAVYSQ